jgi:hypothetical protein
MEPIWNYSRFGFSRMRRASAKAKAIMARDPKQPVNFRDWTEVLAGTVLPREQQSAFKFEVIRYSAGSAAGRFR